MSFCKVVIEQNIIFRKVIQHLVTEFIGAVPTYVPDGFFFFFKPFYLIVGIYYLHS